MDPRGETINTLGPNAWSKPSRGHRRGTLWENVNVEARNQKIRLHRQADLDQIPDGDNFVARQHPPSAS